MSKSTHPQFVVKRVEIMAPQPQTIPAAMGLLIWVASMMFVVIASAKLNAESIPVMNSVKANNPNHPFDSLNAAAAGIAINVSPTEEV